MIDPKKVGERVKQARREKGLRREDVAVRASISMSTVDNLEQGRALPRIDILDRVAEAIGTTASELIAALRQPEKWAA